MNVELKILSDIVKEKQVKHKTGKITTKTVIVKRNVKFRKTIETEEVISISEIFDSKGNIDNRICSVNIKGEGVYTIANSYKNTVKLIYNNKIIKKIGF